MKKLLLLMLLLPLNYATVDPMYNKNTEETASPFPNSKNGINFIAVSR